MSTFPSQLHDEKTFYDAFVCDLSNCKTEVIIESPFITSSRMKVFRLVFKKMLEKGVKIYVFTRDPSEHDYEMAYQAEIEIQNFEKVGVQTLICTGSHHRKLAILDRSILWEGSLNILSQNHSREIMRRIDSKEMAEELFDFLEFRKFI